ncbi:agenet domain-containing protein [Aerosakkonema funiforme]|uniref:Caspase family protein n=2 Tax=Oscillatoriophycideae TaxID=1301283 RepID=A0A926VLH6_9CYAN|nr:agenet domain-containing protein [Aerosakkonema funiforme]MBD2186086.1 caspase family protein [Aerosakkonema funiforme FACHB-1375]
MTRRDWKPQKTWLFSVGILEWENSDVWPGFPEAVEGRFDEKLVEFFRAAGLPGKQIIYLQDSEATIEAIQGSLTEVLANTEEGDLFILYFAGHGDWDSDTGEHYFINYDANGSDRDNYWSISSIFDSIENNFNGSKVLLLADCCYSGGLIDELKRRDSDISYACISSAYTHNTSTGGWTFTESLYKGLLGDPVVDLDKDGVITLYDLARYAELEMAFIEEQKSMFFTTNDFDKQMVFASVSERIESIEGKRVEVEYSGDWYKAKTLETNGSEVRVLYIDDQSEESVESQRIRPYAPDMFAVGERVEAQSDEEWYPAKVKKAWYGLHLVSYDDYPDIWDEWVGSDYIRSRQ